ELDRFSQFVAGLLLLAEVVKAFGQVLPNKRIERIGGETGLVGGNNLAMNRGVEFHVSRQSLNQRRLHVSRWQIEMRILFHGFREIDFGKIQVCRTPRLQELIEVNNAHVVEKHRMRRK